jgi:hypothetical protein
LFFDVAQVSIVHSANLDDTGFLLHLGEYWANDFLLNQLLGSDIFDRIDSMMLALLETTFSNFLFITLLLVLGLGLKILFQQKLMPDFLKSVLRDELSLNHLDRSLHLGFKVLDLAMLLLKVLQDMVYLVLWIIIKLGKIV